MKKFKMIVFYLAAMSVAGIAFCATEEDKVVAIERGADFVVNIDNPVNFATLKLDIGVGEMIPSGGFTGEARKVQVFPMKDLQSFFSQQKHKNSILIIINKNSLSGESLQSLVKSLIDFFARAGYKNVSIIETNVAGSRILQEVKAGG